MLQTMRVGRAVPLLTAALSLLTILATAESALAQGVIVAGVGPVNRSMGSAGTAAPLEAIGAIHWNPGSISGLDASQVSFGVEILPVAIDTSSNIPGVGAGHTSGESGVAAIPNIGWVHHMEGTPYTVGLGLLGIAGFRNNMPADPTNPVIGNNPIFADANFLQIAPTVSYAVNDRLAIGFAPTVTIASININPLGPAVNLLPPGPAGSTPGSGNRNHWGGGAQAGIYYIAPNDVHLGFTVKSPQFFEDFRFFVPANTPAVPGFYDGSGKFKFDFDYPMIISLGAAYTGIQDVVLAADVRYFDYKNTEGFSELGFGNVFAVALGGQYRVNDCWHVRAGYHYNQNPIANADAMLTLPAPLIQVHNLMAGASYRFADNVDINLSYVWLLPSTVTGPTAVNGMGVPLPPPFGGVAPTNGVVSNEIESHSVGFGVTVRY